jgi:hypothetical protein
MTGKQFVVLSLVLPFVALSSAIHADAATAKTRHWAITSFSSSSPVQSEPEAGSGYRQAPSYGYRYFGGPKSGLAASPGEYQRSHPGGR